MDSISDSDSEDAGSIPAGVTTLIVEVDFTQLVTLHQLLF